MNILRSSSVTRAKNSIHHGAAGRGFRKEVRRRATKAINEKSRAYAKELWARYQPMLKAEIAKIEAFPEVGSSRTKQQLIKSREQTFHRRIKVGSRSRVSACVCVYVCVWGRSRVAGGRACGNRGYTKVCWSRL